MKNIFTPKTNTKIRPHDIIVRHHNTATYGDKCFSTLGPKVWNKLPNICIYIYIYIYIYTCATIN